jgi:type I restriction enzyme S subunit
MRYKRGLLQKLFDQEIRLKDDSNKAFPEWDPMELSDLSSKVMLKNREGKLDTVLTNSATQGVLVQTEYFDKCIANKNNLNGYYIVEVDDFVYNPRISINAPVGPIKRNKVSRGVMSPLYTVFRFRKGNLDILEQYFETSSWHDYMRSVANTGARHDRMNITNDNFFALTIPMPIEEEQIKIANFLSAMDKKIASMRARLEIVDQYEID